jgi:hypothetical protein
MLLLYKNLLKTMKNVDMCDCIAACPGHRDTVTHCYVLMLFLIQKLMNNCVNCWYVWLYRGVSRTPQYSHTPYSFDAVFVQQTMTNYECCWYVWLYRGVSRTPRYSHTLLCHDAVFQTKSNGFTVDLQPFLVITWGVYQNHFRTMA